MEERSDDRVGIGIVPHAGSDAADVVDEQDAGLGAFLTVGAGQEAMTERRVGHEADARLTQHR
jgi:hypothetical protein